MAVHLVTWDLNREKPNYSFARDRFLAQLQRHTHIKDPGLDSGAFVSSTLGAVALSSDLQTVLDTNDRIVVATISRGNYWGWLDKETWDWIGARL